jgi:hypothetical protein
MNNFYNFTQTEFSAAIVLLNIGLSLALQLLIIYIYKRTHQGLSYSSSLVFTLAIVGVLATVVMMVVQNNLVGAFGLLGAFSLIRFRTILKETRDIAFVFFALVTGIAIGTNNYAIALISTVLLSLIILLFYRFNIGRISSGHGVVLTFNAKDGFDINSIKSVLSKYSQSFEMLQTRTQGVGIDSYVFSLNLKDNLESVKVVGELKKNNFISEIEIITGEHSVEY